MNAPAYLKFYGKDMFIFTANLKKSEKAALLDGIIHLNMYGFWPENIKNLFKKSEKFCKNFQKIDELFAKSLQNYEKICERNLQNAKQKSLKNKDFSKPMGTQPFNIEAEAEEEEEEIKKEYLEKKTEPALFEKPKPQKEVMFEQFWAAYPKQRAGAKDKALSAYFAALKRHRELTALDLVSKAQEYAQSNEVARGYAKGAQAWLNDDRFLQDYKPAAAGGNALQDARKAGQAVIDEMFGGFAK